ncbi:hypothetical protein [Pseudomonas sp. H9]|uniref:hypothetical protein n=1 Tax=Pseudomonas sp. H9 TaxID=483968 RepID=UPI0010581F5C|nr:hypothetical protein [Pseudomonas sp. H9]TDF80036.1 hypothetical protein E1573_21205 [Pseudomonas sp. H9]
MNSFENPVPTRAALLKSYGTTQAAQNPQSLLHAHMGSYYPGRSVNQRVTLRLIELSGPDEATIIIRVENTHYSATVSRDLAYAYADAFDIIVENGQFRHISEKIVSDTNKPVELITLELPPDRPEQGEKKPIALYAPKNTVISIAGTFDTIKHRTLYHFKNNTSKIVATTIGNRVFEHEVDSDTFGTFVVPGDFTIYENSGYISLVTLRTMPFDNHIRGEDSPIVLPEISRPANTLNIFR